MPLTGFGEGFQPCLIGLRTGELVSVHKFLTRLRLHPAGSTRFAVLSISLALGSHCRFPALSNASALGKRSMKAHA
jgi:hypothetical protein